MCGKVCSTSFETIQSHQSKKKYHFLSKYIPPHYGKKIQYATKDETKPLTEKEIKELQKIRGTFFFYSRAMDSTMAHVLNALVLV